MATTTKDSTTAAKKPTAKKRTPVKAHEPTSTTRTSVVDVMGASTAGLQEIRLEQLSPHPRNPRTDVGDLSDMTASIKAQGIRQPLLVVPHPDTAGVYRIVAGHRRASAAIEAGLVEVPCVVDTDMNETEQLEVMMVENLQRVDLTPFEEAGGYQGLLDLGLDITAISKKTGRARDTVKARLKLGTLDAKVREGVTSKALTMADAITLADIKSKNHGVYQKVVDRLDEGDLPTWVIPGAAKEVEHLERMATMIDKAKASGLKVVKQYRSGMVDIRSLGIKPKAHLECPGALAYITMEYNGPKQTLYCADGQKHHPEEYKARNAVQGRSPEELEEQRQRESNLSAATHARRSWVRTVYTDSSNDARSTRAVLAAMAHVHVKDCIAGQAQMQPDLRVWVVELEGNDAGFEAPKELLDALALAVLSSEERNFPQNLWGLDNRTGSAKQYYAGDNRRAATYLKHLIAAGYPATDFEHDIVDALSASIDDTKADA